MAVDVLNFDDIEDFRYNPFTNILTPKLIGYNGNPTEDRTIPNSAPYIIRLYEGPQANVPSTTRVILQSTAATLREVSKTTEPANNEYRVNYDERGLGYGQFNKNQKGLVVNISYYGLGTVYSKDSITTLVLGGNRTFGSITATGNINSAGGFNSEYRNTVGAESTIFIHEKIIDIGDWNMDTTAVKLVNHGLANFKKIVELSAIIRNDDDDQYWSLVLSDETGATALYSYIRAEPGQIRLSREDDGLFDNNSYDTFPNYNRGRIHILYED